MGDTTKQAEGQQTYYVVKSVIGWYMAERAGRSIYDATEAARFPSANEALQQLAKGSAPGWSIPASPLLVRVTETPGKTEVRLVSPLTINASRPVAIYGVNAGMYLQEKRPTFHPYGSLTTARVFSDLEDALTAIQNEGIGGPLRIHQVEVVTSAPTIIETVLE